VSELDDLRKAASAKLDDQAHRAAAYQAYYDAEPGIIALLDTEERRTFRTFLAESHANWCELVVSAVSERLVIAGFRFGSEEDSRLARTIWQASSMDADAELVHTDALVAGSSFVMVQPDEDNPTGVSMTAESPQECTVLYEPGSRRRRAAGYKRFRDDLGDTTEVLILPDQIVTWYPRSDSRRPLVEPNPAGVVGLVELVPQPRTSKPPRSELVSAISYQDRINTTIFNRLVATDYGAYRQVWATGIKVAREVVKTEGGEAVRVVRPFDVGANRLLVNENPDGRFGSFAESSLGGYLAAVEQDVQQLAATTQTPAHYLTGQLVNLSADAIKAAEAGLVAKCRRRSLHLGEGWEEAIRLALGIVGNPAAADVSAEVLWADFETRSLAQLTDSLVKMASLGVPRRVLWERYPGVTQQEVERWLDLAASEQPAPQPEPRGAPAA
jgi:Phage portal protein, SPP1 Gp6-like